METKGVNLLDNNRLADDIFHELKSIVSSMLSSVELIALYDSKSVPGKISRQADSIKSQVIELDFQLQNIRIIQMILSNSFTLNRKITNIHFFLSQFIREEPYEKLLAPVVELQAGKDLHEALIDEFVVRQLILNLFFWINRHSSSHQPPKLIFSFEENHFEIKGHFSANYTFNQPICNLMAHLTALHDGDFEITDKNIVRVRIPYK
jgi:hypothetical protein